MVGSQQSTTRAGAFTQPTTPTFMRGFHRRRARDLFLAEFALCPPAIIDLDVRGGSEQSNASSIWPAEMASANPNNEILCGISSILTASPLWFALFQKCCDAFFEIGGLPYCRVALYRLLDLTVQLLASIAGKQLLGCL